jgi:cytochrome c oxidase assembly protein subunit 11
MKTDKANRNKHTRLVIKLAGVGVAMFAFGFALVPLYELFCDVTGLNGKTGRISETAAFSVDRSRTLTVEFTGHASSDLPWEFRPLQSKIEVHPGETVTVRYLVRNNADVAVTGQAIPSVAPNKAASHFKKIECFCFSQQTLAAHETREMPVQFIVQPNVAADVHTITLSYAFFNLSRSNTVVDRSREKTNESKSSKGDQV